MARNREGVEVDPVPFLVVTAFAFLLCFSFGPPYGRALGLAWAHAVAASAGVFLLATAAAYHRLVWTARPELRAEIPAGDRLRLLLYAAVAVYLLLLALSLPFF